MYLGHSAACDMYLRIESDYEIPVHIEEEEEKDAFCDNLLQSRRRSLPRGDIAIVIGDLNTKGALIKPCLDM